MGYLLNSKIGKRALSKVISKTVNAKGGTIVSPEHAEARKHICLNCPHYGPTPKDVFLKGADAENGDFVIVNFEGCTKCECPVTTKVLADIIMREKKYIGRPITLNEITKRIVINGKNLYPDKNKCSDEKVDRWAEADKKFFNN